MTTIEQIKKLISQGKTERALALLLEHTKDKGGDAEQHALLLSGQFKQWKRSSVIGLEQSSNDLRRIELGILQAIDNQDSTSYAAFSTRPEIKKKSLLPVIATIFGIIGICIAAWVVIDHSDHQQNTSSSSTNTQEQLDKNPSNNTALADDKEDIPSEPVPSSPPITEPEPAPFKYKTVDLAGLTWMSENLNENTSNSLCYQDDSYNCTLQGRLYTWASARKTCQSLGDGWRLPTGNDWKKLTRMYGGAYADLDYNGKSAYQQLNKGGSTGFNGALGGKRIYFSDQQAFYYYDFDGIGYYWADEADTNDPARARMFTFRSTDNMVLYESIPNTDFISCRCVK